LAYHLPKWESGPRNLCQMVCIPAAPAKISMYNNFIFHSVFGSFVYLCNTYKSDKAENASAFVKLVISETNGGNVIF
jgi:hypothetical protein